VEEKEKAMTTLYQGKEAIADNFKRYISAQDDPAAFNLNVALEAILDGLIQMKRDIDKIETTVDQIASRQR
jgi:hypothetical protein